MDHREIIKLVNKKIDSNKWMDYLSHDGMNGGLVYFIGTVRNSRDKEKVLNLEFECYEPMAIKVLHHLTEESRNKFGNVDIVLIHRLGVVSVGEAAVFIGVGSKHRKAAFGACEFLIDKLKERVPIWKKEIYKNGHYWISAHP